MTDTITLELVGGIMSGFSMKINRTMLHRTPNVLLIRYFRKYITQFCSEYNLKSLLAIVSKMPLRVYNYDGGNVVYIYSSDKSVMNF